MRIMAGGAIPILHRLVLEFCGLTLFFKIIMAIKAKLAIGLDG